MRSLLEEWTKVATRIILVIAFGLFQVFLWKLYNARILFYRMRKQGMPMPPWNPLFGHLLVLAKVLPQIPAGANQAYMLGMLSKDFPESENLYYIDLWPFSVPMIIISTPGQAYQVCQEFDMPRPASLISFFRPLTGGTGLFVMNGTDVKTSRALFNPGFAPNVVLEHTGHIVDEAEVLVSKLREHAKNGTICKLDDLICAFMMDVIGTVCLDARLKSQTSDNILASALRNAVDTQVRDEQLNPFIRYSPIRPFREWYNSYKMDTYIAAELDKRYEEWRSSSNVVKTKSVMDLALADYMKGKKESETLDPAFKTWACAQIRLFLFVGHDSTAASIVYSLYLLSKHPDAMARICSEHDSVFGKDFTEAPRLLKQKPHLVNQLPFTVAVIKEALRLFPPAGTFRGGLPNAYLRNTKTNEQYPTENFGCLILHDTLQRHPDYWAQCDEFVPDRWLVEPGHALYPPKNAWRAFEFGPRNCIGQTLVMLDMKIALLMIVREFDVSDAYAELDIKHRTKGVKTVNGERVYQVAKGSLHPVDGYPCRVTLR